jgi:carboxymethylenebutenolidase
MRTDTIKLKTFSGDTTAFVAFPEDSNGKAVVVVQEWWGLNDHVKDIVGRYADEGYTAFAPDLYRGKLAKDPDEASKMMGALSSEDGLATIDACIKAAVNEHGFSHLGITGYCMGGTFALRAACTLEGLSAAVPFYGDIPEEEILKKLRVPTLFISGTKDAWINPEKVASLEDAAERYELPIRTLKYEADHAFFNNTRPEVYDADAARDAWVNALAFFNEHL